MSFADDVKLCEYDLAHCPVPEPCESCDVLRRLLDRIKKAEEALRMYQSRGYIFGKIADDYFKSVPE